MLLREALGFEYLCASNKNEFNEIKGEFFTSVKKSKPIVLEIFTTTEDESKALELIINICRDTASSAKDVARNILGESGVQIIKRIIGRE